MTGSYERVEVTDLGELANALRRLQDEWKEIAVEALADAFLLSGFLEAVWVRTPKSSREKYASRYSSVVLKVDRRDSSDPADWSTALRSGWADRLLREARENGTRALDKREAAVARLNEYGMERLANSLLPNGINKSSLQVAERDGGIALILSSSVPYAARMHETDTPAEGDYWIVGRKTGWSARNTGNRYIERPYEEYQDRIVEEFGKQIDRRLRGMGLL